MCSLESCKPDTSEGKKIKVQATRIRLTSHPKCAQIVQQAPTLQLIKLSLSSR
jgi:hypothetical protein